MKRELLPAVVVILLGLQTLSLGSPRSASQSDVAAEEYTVYAAIISNMFAGDKVTFDTQSKIKLLVINDHTTGNHYFSGQSDEDWQYTKQQFPSISEETINDYKTKSKSSYQLKNSFDLKIKYVLVENKEIEQIFRSGPKGWEEFYRKYPDSGGLISFSRVGFNREMNQALVYVEHGCGGLCGTGHYVLLSKGREGWRVDKRYMVWVS